MKNLVNDIAKQLDEANNKPPKGTRKPLTAKALPNDPNDPNVLIRGFGLVRKSQAEKMGMEYEPYKSPIKEGAAQDNPMQTYGMKGQSAQQVGASMQRGPTHQEMMKAQKQVQNKHDPGHKMVGVSVGLDGKVQVKSAVTQTSIVGEDPKKPADKAPVKEGFKYDVDHMNGKRDIGLDSVKSKDTYVKTYVASQEKEANEYAKKHGHIVKKHEYGKGHNNRDDYEWQVHIKEEIELSEVYSKDHKKLAYDIGMLHAMQKKKSRTYSKDPELKAAYDLGHKHGKENIILKRALSEDNLPLDVPPFTPYGEAEPIEEAYGGKYPHKVKQAWTTGKMAYAQTNNGKIYRLNHQKMFGKLPNAGDHLITDHHTLISESVETKVQMTMPLFIRLMEWAREECKDDVEIHKVAEALAAVNGVADMDNYKSLFEETQLDEANSWMPDYSKHSTDHLKTLLQPGVLHKSESKYKMFIRRELKKRESNKMNEDWREERKKAAAKRAAELDADIKKNPVTPEETARAEKLLAGAIKTGKFMKDKMGA